MTALLGKLHRLVNLGLIISPRIAGFQAAVIAIAYGDPARVQVFEESQVDGIIAMEGDGPSSGTPRRLGRVLASPDWMAIDIIACRMIGISPPVVPTIKAAIERGDISSDHTSIRLTGDESDLPVIQGFRLPSTYRGEGMSLEKNLLLSTLHNLGRLSTLYPVINRSTCVQCGRCAMICPVRSISFNSQIPEITRKSCIRCSCCHEICPKGAIQLKPGLTCRMIRKLTGRG